MANIRKWLEGKKSYVTVAAAVVVAGVQVFAGVEIPEFVWMALAGILGITYKAGQNRLEAKVTKVFQLVKEVEAIGADALKDAKDQLK